MSSDVRSSEHQNWKSIKNDFVSTVTVKDIMMIINLKPIHPIQGCKTHNKWIIIASDTIY